MQPIEAILFDPVGSLAEFSPEEFEAIAVHMLGRGLSADASGSQAYWDLVNLIDARGALDADEQRFVEECEIRAVDRAQLYEDALPALSELSGLGARLMIASSLSETALGRFLDRFALRQSFIECVSRDTAGGVKSAPLAHALHASGLAPDRTLFLADTAAGLQA